MEKPPYRASVLARGCTSSSPIEMNDVEMQKNQIRAGMLTMNATEREAFVQALETELQGAGFTMRSYLVPLGIPARRPDELTPVEVAHFVRFLRINVPRAAPAITKVLARFGAFAMEGAAEPLAA